MITNQVEIYINLSHAKTNLKIAKSLLREIINNNIAVADEFNLKTIEELEVVNEEILNYLNKIRSKEI